MTRADQDTPPLEQTSLGEREQTRPLTRKERAAFGGHDRQEAAHHLGRQLRRVCLEQAWDHYREHDFEVAEGLCRELLASDQQSVPYRVLLAVCLFRRGQAEEALKEIERLVQEAPESPDLLELRALLRAS